MFKAMRNLGMMIMVSAALFGCQKSAQNAASDAAQNGLTIIAGSEINNIAPILQAAEAKLGFPINVKYVGTIEGVDTVKSGGDYSVAWFGNSKYFYDTPENAKRIKLSEKIMLSPVIVGVKESSFAKNGLKTDGVYTWKDIASWVKDKHMTYAMTDPSVSNTGYVALMGVTYATANKGENLTMNDVNANVLKDFFAGQKVTAKSSNWIMNVFDNDPNIDFVVNYESTILSNTTKSKLIPVYPSEGIVTSDYPMLLLDSSKAEKYKQLVAYLKSPEVQTQLVETYKYHSVLADVTAKQKVFDNAKLLIEMPFNPAPELSDSILTAYFNDYKKPAKFAFVIDTSGSMSGSREAELKQAVAALTSGQLSKFATIRNRESVIVVPFQSQPYDLQTFTDKQKTQLNDYVQSLRMDGGTAMFDAVAKAIVEMRADQKVNGDKYRYSVIVLTDGETNTGSDFNGFKEWYASQGITNGDMRVFAISFGDADMTQLKNMTELTGGSVFDGKKSLASAFREIRSYQ
jgi:Ca-activated chloride channel family protein